MSWGPLQFQHCDVVGLGGAEQGSGHIKSLLGAPCWPVSSQIHTINPNLTLCPFIELEEGVPGKAVGLQSPHVDN